MASKQAVQTGRPKKLLSLDGGGVKGISALLILKAIMEEIARIEDGHEVVNDAKSSSSRTTQAHAYKERKPVDYFDLTGGTSTGGIIAVMLSRLDMTCTAAIHQYDILAKDIFAVRIGPINVSKIPILNYLSPVILGIKALFGSQFSQKYLNESIQHILNQYLIKGKPVHCDQEPLLVDKIYNPHDARGKMLMCATMANRGKALLFRDYTPPGDAIPETGAKDNDEEPPPPASPYPEAGRMPTLPIDPLKKYLMDFDYNKVTIQQAVRATSAAPTYLPPERFQHIQFWDGGLLNNNPIDQVWAARYDLTPTSHDEPYVQTVLSIGCTYQYPAAKVQPGLLAKLFRVVNFASNTDAKHFDFKRNIYRRNLRQPGDQQTNYFRFNAPVEGIKINLADYKKMPELRKATEKYLAIEETQRKIKAIAKLLAKGPAASDL